jgi:hypothetical protein
MVLPTTAFEEGIGTGCAPAAAIDVVIDESGKSAPKYFVRHRFTR